MDIFGFFLFMSLVQSPNSKPQKITLLNFPQNVRLFMGALGVLFNFIADQKRVPKPIHSSNYKRTIKHKLHGRHKDLRWNGIYYCLL